jgi:class 3 adenylate cyclase
MVTAAATTSILLGVPYILTEVSHRQMNSHAKTLGLFIQQDLKSLNDHEPGIFTQVDQRERLRFLASSELVKAAQIAEQAGSFSIRNMDLFDPNLKPVLNWTSGQPWGDDDQSFTVKDLQGTGPILRPDIRNGRPDPQVEELIVPVPVGTGPPWVIRIHLDSARSTELHQDQYLAIQLLAVTVLLLIFVGLLIGLLRFLGAVVFRPATELSLAFSAVSAGDLNVRVIEGADEIGRIGQQFNVMVRGLQENSALRPYISRSTQMAVQRAVATGVIHHLPERKDLSVFFSDIRGFTTYAEERSPQDVVRILNRILNLQASVIRQSGGDVDKFIGDGIMATFPDRESAFLSAVKIQHLMKRLYADLDGLTIGIGICHGLVVQGDVGVGDVRDFTVIGDTVNTASRLQSVATGGEILVLRADSLFPARCRWKTVHPRRLLVKGKRISLDVVSLVGLSREKGK